MNGFLKDITYARSGECILSIYTRESCKQLWEQLAADHVLHCKES